MLCFAFRTLFILSHSTDFSCPLQTDLSIVFAFSFPQVLRTVAEWGQTQPQCHRNDPSPVPESPCALGNCWPPHACPPAFSGFPRPSTNTSTSSHKTAAAAKQLPGWLVSWSVGYHSQWPYLLGLSSASVLFVTGIKYWIKATNLRDKELIWLIILGYIL